ncbi:MAG: hypothetical protein LBN21_03685 [Treponema sp.]|jgi:hypothetical protein|nr:hypothetical protein [Treponema sp.]
MKVNKAEAEVDGWRTQIINETNGMSPEELKNYRTNISNQIREMLKSGGMEHLMVTHSVDPAPAGTRKVG